MNLKKIVLPFALLLSLSSCITSHIEDINGKDDYTLATLTHEDVLAEIKSSIKANSIMNYVMNANESYFLMIAGESCHFEIKYSFVRK